MSNNTELERKLNWLRAAVLGANDGIVSVAGLLMGVAGAGGDSATLLLAGVAALVAGAISMGGGEYVSVSAQRDTEVAAGRKGTEVNAHPWGAAWSSFLAFTAGAILPLVAITGPWTHVREYVTVGSVILALAITGWWAAWAGGSPILKSIVRNVAISILTMGISYGIGAVLGVTVL